MESFFLCLNAIVPIFLIIAAGYLAKRAGIVRVAEIPRMNAMAFKCFMPVMCFYNVYHSDLSSSVRPALFVYTFAAILLVFFASLLYAIKCVPVRSRRSVVVQGLYRSNFLIVGVAFVSGLMGEGELGARRPRRAGGDARGGGRRALRGYRRARARLRRRRRDSYACV